MKRSYEKMVSRRKRILIVAAHPDDEVLGCGGTAARLIKEGNIVYTLILGEGITSRDLKRDVKKRKKEILALKQQLLKANRLMGIKKVFLHDFPDNRFDTAPFLDIVKAIEKVKSDIRPSIIFTHFEKDLNLDHQIVYKAVITATRPLRGESVKQIYCFGIPSSTEWSCPSNFSPDIFYDISKTLDLKLEAFKQYKMEMREYPHPRSVKGLRTVAQFWGMKSGLECAEAFKVARIIK